jgi:hypothetical protein
VRPSFEAKHRSLRTGVVGCCGRDEWARPVAGWQCGLMLLGRDLHFDMCVTCGGQGLWLAAVARAHCVVDADAPFFFKQKHVRVEG